MHIIFSLVSLLLSLWTSVAFADDSNQQAQMAISLPAGSKECLYHDLKSDEESLIVSYQVLAGGNFEVDFEVTSPSGEKIVKEERQKYADFVLRSFGLGQYSFCFYNNQGGNLKMVEFVLELQKNDEDEDNEILEDDFMAKHSMDEIDRNLNKISKIMDYLRAREWRNMSTVESTNSRLSWLSTSIVIIMITISLGQSFFIQFLFRNNYRPWV